MIAFGPQNVFADGLDLRFEAGKPVHAAANRARFNVGATQVRRGTRLLVRDGAAVVSRLAVVDDEAPFMIGLVLNEQWMSLQATVYSTAVNAVRKMSVVVSLGVRTAAGIRSPFGHKARASKHLGEIWLHFFRAGCSRRPSRVVSAICVYGRIHCPTR